MNLSKLKSDWSLSITAARSMMISNVILVAVVVILALMSFRQRERVVIIPPHMDKQVEVAWNGANEAYYKGMGMYVATLLANVTPTNIQFVMDTLRGMFERDVYTPLAIKLLALSKEASFMRNTSINFFSPTKVTFEQELNKVFVAGSITNSNFQGVDGFETTALKVRPVIDIVTYEMVFTMKDGRPVVTAFTSYPGDIPHTQKWLKQNEQMLKAEKEAQANALQTVAPQVKK